MYLFVLKLKTLLLIRFECNIGLTIPTTVVVCCWLLLLLFDNWVKFNTSFSFVFASFLLNSIDSIKSILLFLFVDKVVGARIPLTANIGRFS